MISLSFWCLKSTTVNVQTDAENTERPLKLLAKNMQSNGQPFRSQLQRVNPFHGTGVCKCCLIGWLWCMHTSLTLLNQTKKTDTEVVKF